MNEEVVQERESFRTSGRTSHEFNLIYLESHAKRRRRRSRKLEIGHFYNLSPNIIRQEEGQTISPRLLDPLPATDHYNNAWAIENNRSMQRVPSQFERIDQHLQAEKPRQKAPSRCSICRSLQHTARKCPSRNTAVPPPT